MKNILVLVLMLQSCFQAANQNNRRFSVDVWDSDYSMAHTMHYRINNDSVIVNSISGIQGEVGRLYSHKSLTDAEKNKLYNFLSSFPLNELSSEYKNTLVDDGDQKRVTIVLDDNSKTIELSNFYQKDIANLFKCINEVVEDSLQIKYKK